MELLLAALTGQVSIGLATQGAIRGIDSDDFEIDVEEETSPLYDNILNGTPITSHLEMVTQETQTVAAD